MLEGKKTIESRFSKNKIAPYEKIAKDDIVLVRKSKCKALPLNKNFILLRTSTKKI